MKEELILSKEEELLLNEPSSDIPFPTQEDLSFFGDNAPCKFAKPSVEHIKSIVNNRLTRQLAK